MLGIERRVDVGSYPTLLRAEFVNRLNKMSVALALAVAALVLLTVMPAHAVVNDDVEIVYFDEAGVIRVIDPNPPTDSLAVTWVSPDGGWTAIAVGDVTNDGDAEIIAMRGTEDDYRLVVFDPVALSAPAERVRYHNGVPWAILADIPLARRPIVITAGEFNPARPGREIAYAVELEPGESQFSHRVEILHQPEGSTDGTQWELFMSFPTPTGWTWMSAGDADQDGRDELVLVDEVTGKLGVYGVDEAGATPLFVNTNGNYPWIMAELLQYIPGGPLELTAVREAPLGLASLWVFRFENGVYRDHFGDIHLPPPLFAFPIDISGNGDQEIALLRDVPQEVSNRPRLWIRDNGNEFLGLVQALLDGDNGYKVGAAGDIDGDGLDELVIMRNNRIRIYGSPNQNAAFSEIAVRTDSRTLKLANVDAAGLGPRPRLGVSPLTLDWIIEPGETIPAQTLTVRDVAQGSAIVVRPELRNAPWARITPSDGFTPATFTLYVDTENLAAGVYRGEVVFSTIAPNIDNNPVIVPLTLTLTSPVSVEPEALVFTYYPCAGALNARTTDLVVNGPSAPLRVSIEGAPDWLEVTPAEGQIPLALEVSVDPNARMQSAEQADIVLSYDLPNAVGLTRRVPVTLLCADERSALPIITAE